MGETGSRPLAGKRVLVTRAAEQSHALVEALSAAGADALVVPLVAFAPPNDFIGLDRCLKGAAGKFDWVFFTSQNSVRALQERCEALGRSLAESIANARIAVVGPSTATATRGAGLNVDYVSKVHNGVALADELANEVNGKRVFLPRSDRANPDLIAALARHGARVVPAVAYRTVAAESDLKKIEEIVATQSADSVLFFSPSAVHHLRELLGIERFRGFGRQAAFVAIGPVSARALQEEGVERVLVASDATVDATLAAVAEFFGKAGRVQPAGAKPQ